MQKTNIKPMMLVLLFFSKTSKFFVCFFSNIGKKYIHSKNNSDIVSAISFFCCSSVVIKDDHLAELYF